MEPKIYHFGWQGGNVPKGTRKHNGVMTVAVREVDNGNKLHIGFTFCSPKDCFSRKVGRIEALRRMRTYPLVVKVLDNRRRLVHEVIRSLCFGKFDKLQSFAEECTIDPHWVPNWAGKWYILTDFDNNNCNSLVISKATVQITVDPS